MNFLADESVDRQIVQRLRKDGYSVLYIAETNPGITDEAVLDLANRNASILITSDKGFGEMVFHRRWFSHGVILLRLAGFTSEVKASTTASAIRQHETEIPDSFSVITPRTIRIRHVRP